MLRLEVPSEGCDFYEDGNNLLAGNRVGFSVPKKKLHCFVLNLFVIGSVSVV